MKRNFESIQQSVLGTIVIPDARGSVVMGHEDIIYIQYEGMPRVYITKNKFDKERTLSDPSRTMNAYADRLKDSGFFRINRYNLVNRKHVVGIIEEPRAMDNIPSDKIKRSYEEIRKGDLNRIYALVVMSNGHHLVISRRKRSKFKQWLEEGEKYENSTLLTLEHSEVLFTLNDLLKYPNPTRRDFETRIYYTNPKFLIKVWENINSAKKCLVVGKPGSGKTALACGIGFEFEQRDSENITFYIEGKNRPPIITLLKEMAKYDQPDSLFIFDNCHAAIDATNRLVSDETPIKRAKILFISRRVNPELAGTTGESYLERLQNVTVPLKIDETIVQNIIENLVNRPDVTSENIGDTKAILDKCHGDLHILKFYVGAWVKSQDSSIQLSNLKETSVLENIYRYYILEDKIAALTLRIAALSQFEIRVEASWFDEADKRKLQHSRLGTIEVSYDVIMGKPIRFYHYFHSTPATLLVQAAARKGDLDRKSSEEYIFDCLEAYLSFKPYNFFEVFLQLTLNDRNDLQIRLYEQTDSLNWFLKWAEKEGENILLDEDIFRGFMRFMAEVAKWNSEEAIQLLRNTKEVVGPSKWIKRMNELSYGASRYLLRSLVRIDHSYSQELTNSLDFGALGKQAKEDGVGFASLMWFLLYARRAELRKFDIRAFCTALDFSALGKQAKDDRVGLATVRSFIKLTYQAGVRKFDIRAFCIALDFGALGKQAKEDGVGLATVRSFIELTYQARVRKFDRRAFCTALDFSALGKKAKNDGVGLVTIKRFLDLTYQAGVRKVVIRAFCNTLDWRSLGKTVVGENSKLRIAPFYLFNFFLSCEGINQKMAKEFITGIGWQNLKTGMMDYFNPDGLAALRILLIDKCRYSATELKETGLEWKSKIVWFRAFTNNPCSVSEFNYNIIMPYLKYARNGLLYEDISPLLESDDMDLRAWQIFIYNMSHADPGYISSTVMPILKSLSISHLEDLFIQADLRDIGYFFSHFNPKDGIVDWRLPSDIDYRKIDFVKALPKATLIVLAHFIFNYYFVKESKWSHFFAQELDDIFHQILPKVEESSLNHIELFMWNWWLAYREGEVPKAFSNQVFAEILTEKFNREKDNQQSILGIVGTIYLAGLKRPELLSGKIREREAVELCKRMLKENSVRAIRCMGGLKAFSEEHHSSEWLRNEGIPSVLEIDFHIEVPNQKALIIDRLKKWPT